MLNRVIKTILLLVSFSPFAALQAAPAELRLGILTFRPQAETLSRWKPTLDHLEKENPEIRIQPFFLNYKEINERVASGSLDLVITNPGHYILLMVHHRLGRIATLRVRDAETELTGFGGVIAVRNNDDSINSLNDLKGKRIASPSAESLGGYQVQAALLLDHGIAPHSYDVIFTDMPHDKAVFRVLNNEADAAFVRTSVIEAMEMEGKIPKGSLRVLNPQMIPGFPFKVSTPLVPEWPFGVMPHVPEKISRSLTVSLLSMQLSQKQAEEAGYSGWSFPADYEPVRKILNDLRVPPYDTAFHVTLKDVMGTYWLPAILLLSGLIVLIAVLFILIYFSKALQEKTRSLRAITYSMSEGIYVIDDSGRITFVNPAASEILGYTEKELIGADAHSLFHSHEMNGNLSIADCPVYQAMRHGENYSGEEFFRHKDGRIMTVRLSARPLKKTGNPDGSIAVFEDISSLKLTEKNLRESEERYRLAQTAAGVGIWDWDIETDTILWDEHCWLMLGYHPEKDARLLNYEYWRSNLHPDDLKEAEPEVQKQLSEGNNFIIEFRLRTAEGGWLWIQGRGKVVKLNDQGYPARMTGTHTDISARKRKEHQMEELNSRLSSLIDAIPDILFIVDRDGTFLDYRAPDESLFVVPPAQFTGKKITDILPPGPAGICMKAVNDAYETGYAKGAVYSLETQGGLKWFELSVARKQRTEGEAEQLIALARDITVRKEHEMILANFNDQLVKTVEKEIQLRSRTEKVYQTLFEHSPEGILIMNLDGVILKCNPAAEAFLGYGAGELPGRSVSEISPETQPGAGVKSSSMLSAKILNHVFKGNSEQFDWIHLKKDGTPVPVSVLLAPFGTDREEILVLWRDNSELRRLQNEREKQQAMLIQTAKQAELGNLIGMIAHQWKQPLNAIALLVQDLPDTFEGGELTQEVLEKYTEQIMHQVLFMSETIEDFRRFYKPSDERSVFDPVREIRWIADLFQKELRKSGIELEITGESGFAASGNSGEFKQVILNIINNAKDALLAGTAEKRRITVRTEIRDRSLIIAICDNGGGIPGDWLPDKIFEPFATTKGEKGTGIGLSLGRTIIEEKMNGSLTAYNTDEGACFEISLPETLSTEE